MKIEQYFKYLRNEVDKIYSLSEEARAKGLDPVDKVEIPLAMSMAEKVVGLISTIYPQMSGAGIDKRILELEKEHGKLAITVVFKIAEEVAKQKFCKFSSVLEAMDAGIRVGFAYTTLAVVSSPIEGFTGLKIRRTRENKEYIEANFSGPIRSAGTTASCVVLILIDYLREIFGYSKYDPTEEEIKRVVAEISDFHERITNLQYLPTEEEMIFLAKHLPIQIAGEASESLEVSNYKNLERVDTNYLRSGFCLVLAEGLAQKAAKGFRLLNQAKKDGIVSSGFDFLEEYVQLHEKRTIGKSQDGLPTYIKDLVAGRPVFGHPSKSGGFRFRYGRGRTSGFSAASLHPATMAITDGFIAIGTQLKIEKPTKGTAITSCNSIEGPIVKLFNGSVKKISDRKFAKKVYSEIEEIIYLGDILFPFSDVANRNSKLIKPGYVEEWWYLELKEKDEETAKGVDLFNVSLEQAMELSEKYGLPLHPSHIYFWTEISNELFLALLDWISHARVNKKIILPYTRTDKERFCLGKRALELLGIEHEVTIENVVLSEEDSKNLFVNLGLNVSPLDVLDVQDFFLEEIDFSKYNLNIPVLEIINLFSKYKIKDKAGDFIGSRMGRPEKAKLRKLVGSPNVLFPVGSEGGRLRSMQSACEIGSVRSDFPLYYCEKCQKETIYPSCEICGEKCKKEFYFFDTGEKSFNKKSPVSEKEGVPYKNRSIDISYYLNNAKSFLKIEELENPLLIKAIRGTSSNEHCIENICKGILRAKYNLQVNKDGTIRFDATELPLVSFKPKEISVSIEKLRELGYEKDFEGKELVSEEQIVELMPHDIVLPSCLETPDERSDHVFIRICNFIDELLVRFYKLKPFYNVKKREDLVGKFGVCMAPHNCAGVICRFIGFSNTLGLFASPYMHAAIRRDCDGDEAAIMLLGDVLLNFSRKFLPGHRGGTQDAPLVLNAKIDAGEVDDQILDFESLREYPLELYSLAEKREHSSLVKLNTVKRLLREGKNPFINLGFTHDTSDFNGGVVCSSYKTLATMQEKVDHQMKLIEKIRAADTADTAQLIIDRHFLRDIKGNLRKFSTQGFRCVDCNEIMRRPPISGVCSKCGKGKLIFTIHEGGIKKYLEIALDLTNKYNLSPYTKQNIELTKRYIDSIFGKEPEKQKTIQEWFA